MKRVSKGKIKNRPTDTECMFYRMTEFYNIDSLNNFITEIDNAGLDIDNAFTRLDMQTRVNYVTCVETSPDLFAFTRDYIRENTLKKNKNL